MTSNRCKVKICGTTSVADARMAADAAADYSGIVVEVAFSERSVSIDSAAEITRQTPIPTVILVFDRPTDWVKRAAAQIKPFAIQLLGHEPPAQVAALKKSVSCEVWKSLFLPTESEPGADEDTISAQIAAHIDAGADALLFDTAELKDGKARFGGTGKQSDWNLSARLIQACRVPAFLSGGIRPENVRTAIETVRPFGVDLCSGVEASKGIRDRWKLEKLMENAQSVSG